MKLNEERNYQMLLNTLDEMELSEENRRLAEEYLETSQAENRELLKGAKPQDFSRLGDDKRKKCVSYLEHLKKRGRTEEYGRFVRFAAAVGGSTAKYVLVSYGYALSTMLEYLTREQIAAIRAEVLVWNKYTLREAHLKVLYEVGKKNPEVLVNAMQICYHGSDNAKSILAASYLFVVKPEEKKSAFLKNLLSKPSEPDENLKKTVEYMENNLVDSLSNIFQGQKPMDSELKLLKDFIRHEEPDAPITAEVANVFTGKQISEYLVTLLAGEAFLGIDHSNQFLNFLRLMAVADQASGRMTTLDTCFEIGGAAWFYDHAKLLEKTLSVSDKDYIKWCLKRKATGPLRRLAVSAPDAVKEAAASASLDDYQVLMNQIQVSNQKLYEEMNRNHASDFRMKTAEALTARYSQGRMEAVQYLLGEGSLDALYPYVQSSYRSGYDYYDNERCRRIQMLGSSEEKQMYRRAVVLEGLGMRARYFTSYFSVAVVNGKQPVVHYQEVGKAEIEKIIGIFEEEKLPLPYQLEAFQGIHDSYYNEKSKTNFVNESVKVLARRKEKIGAELAVQAREGSAFVRFLSIRVLDIYWKEYKEALLSCALDSSKQVRELLTAVYESHREWEPEVKAMLASKKSQEREMAALVIKKWGAGSFKEELSAAYEAEKSKKLKELLAGLLGAETESTGEKQAGEPTMDELVSSILKGGKKRKVAWAFETPFPEVHKADGSLASEDYLAAILVSYADMGIPGANKEAAKLAAGFNQKELAACMNLLFGKWLDSGAEAKKKWVLYAASIHGGEDIIPALNHQIQEWPKSARGAMAAEAVRALALNGSATALLLVDQISRKFKFRQVKVAAAGALDYAAEQLGITRDELEDRIVPNLGFDENMERTFDYGPRSFRVVLTPSLEAEVFDESGKKLKNLPAPGKKDEEEKAKAANEAFKLMKKQLKTVTANQKLRLEQALSTERLWQVDKWQELFVKNPVMHQFAMGLIWGRYENGELKDTFRYMEDGSFNTVDEDEYEFPESGTIGLVHPIELSEEDLSAWKEQLSDYEVVQPVEQLSRPIYRITEEERQEKELTRFGGMLLNGLSLSGKLQAMGWYRGSVQDAGGYYTFYREDGEIGVELEFSGCFVGDENEEVTVYGATFYRAGTVKRGSYVYDTVKVENQYALGEVNARYFSEIVLQLAKATASSKERLAYPECRN